jgi:hypothetical protein
VLVYIIHSAWKIEEIFLRGIQIVSCKKPLFCHPTPGKMERFEEIQYFLYVVEEQGTRVDFEEY